jgi:hypothetical protein
MPMTTLSALGSALLRRLVAAVRRFSRSSPAGAGVARLGVIMARSVLPLRLHLGALTFPCFCFDQLMHIG